MADVTVAEPFPISLIAGRYLLFDIDAVTYIRRKYHLCGVLIGNIPQAAQQTVFSGLPLQLMPEEARLLVDKGVAYVVDDCAAHEKDFTDLEEHTRSGWRHDLEQKGLETAKDVKRLQDERKKAGLAKAAKAGKTVKALEASKPSLLEGPEDHEEYLFDSPANSFPTPRATPSPALTTPKVVEPHPITPTTSYPPLLQSAWKATQQLPAVPSSYPLFAYLQGKGYFMSPGLRFGCQYVAYPGDPLRYHSHFLVSGYVWDEEIDLLAIVGGGRLGTGVKKGFLIGGKSDKSETVKTFTFEWAAM